MMNTDEMDEVAKPWQPSPPTGSRAPPPPPVGQVPSGGVLLDERGRLQYVLWYSSPFNPKDRTRFDLKKAVMLISIWAGIVLFLSCLLSLVAGLWTYSIIELLFLLVIPLCGYLGASRERTSLLIVFIGACVCCIILHTMWWVVMFAALIRVGQMSDSEFTINYPNYSKPYSICLTVATLMLAMVIIGFWVYAVFIGCRLRSETVDKQRMDRANQTTQMSEINNGIQHPYAQYTV